MNLAARIVTLALTLLLELRARSDAQEIVTATDKVRNPGRLPTTLTSPSTSPQGADHDTLAVFPGI